MSASPAASPTPSPAPAPAATAGRYLRHTQIEGFSQPAVARLRIIVVGAGAIGNEVIKNLVLLGAAQQGRGLIRLHDFDRVEAHNLTRSVLLRPADIGHDKAASVASHARELDPAVRIDATGGDIADTLSLADVIDADIVIGCVDNFEARIRINQLARLAATPWINTAIDSRYASVEVFPFAGAEAAPCFECGLPASVYERLAQRRSCGGLLKLAQAEQIMPTTALTTSVAAALAVSQALILTGCDQRVSAAALPSSIRLFSDGQLGTTSRSELARASLCACCDALPWQIKLQGRAGTMGELRQWARQAGLSTSAQLQLSDALIASAACTHCGPQANTDALIGRRAASVPDAVVVCAHCGHASVAVDIQDRFVLSDLDTLPNEHVLPGSWAAIDDHYLSLQAEPSNWPHTPETPS